MKLLHIVATPRGAESNTLPISNAFIDNLKSKHSDLEVSEINPFFTDIPLVSKESTETKYSLMGGQGVSEENQQEWSTIESLISDFKSADFYLITTPLWNFNIPYALKAYIDAIVQPGYLFKYDETGTPIGLVTGKKMVCICSTGGDYSPNSPMNALNYIEPYLRSIFGFVGITDIDFITAGPMNYTPEVKEMATNGAISAAKNLATSI